jgi:hypothetical protein
VSPSAPRRKRSKAKAPVAGKRNRSNRSRGRSGNRPRQARQAAVDSRRPFWANDAAEAEVRALTGVVRPVADPTALVRSLGTPPLGKFADGAQHYYAAVYEKAQRFAVAMATANGVLLAEDDEAES